MILFEQRQNIIGMEAVKAMMAPGRPAFADELSGGQLLLTTFLVAVVGHEVMGLSWALAFALGAIVGSFLNVVIHRVPREESIVFPNSDCPKCKTPIKPYDNIPV